MMEDFGPRKGDPNEQHVTVWGTVADAAQVPQNAKRITLEFRLSRPGTSTDGLMQTTAPVLVTPDADGRFLVRLVPNDLIRGNTIYQVVATWLDESGQLVRRDGYDIFVPQGGGEISELAPASIRPAQVFWQATRPDPWPAGSVWISSITGDVLRKR